MDYTVKKSRTGLGLFASRPYKKGEFVIEYVGDIIDQEEANRRGGQYLFEVNRKITIDGSLRSNVARYINHACKGENCEVRIKKDECLFTQSNLFFLEKNSVMTMERNFGMSISNQKAANVFHVKRKL